MKKVLITGALGQIGSELTERLRHNLGADNVIATDIREIKDAPTVSGGRFELLDVLDGERMLSLAKENGVDTIIHLASLLSAVAEAKPQVAWHLNMGGLINSLETARKLGLQHFSPSSIAAFGPSTPMDNTPQVTIQRPTTMYGVTKVAMELLGDYYFTKFGVDTRGVRFPGLISYKTLPGGGTTDYAVDIYIEALKSGHYDSFIKAGTKMDMMYMPDAIDAIVDLLNAPAENLKDRNAFNITAMSFEPEEIAASIRKEIPGFTIGYYDDPRQKIADSWPNSIDASEAKKQWGFHPKYDLDAMTKDMLKNLKKG
ncbi:MAG: NAD-dependent epimerase/dehydratase family protein [Streptococcaceae bacterium]|nr:NAD-dependent epimerase/dehydratase family protein [Streptococcaceae bacterium]